MPGHLAAPVAALDVGVELGWANFDQGEFGSNEEAVDQNQNERRDEDSILSWAWISALSCLNSGDSRKASSTT